MDDEIRGFVMRGYEMARRIVEEQRDAVKAVAEELLEVESIDADRLKELLGGITPQAMPPSDASPASPEAQL